VSVAVSAFAALEAARRAGDRAAEAAALVAMAEETPLLSANFERAGWWLLEAQEIAASLGGLPEVEARALARFASLARRAGGLDEAREAARAAGAPVLEALAALDAQDVDGARAALAGATPPDAASRAAPPAAEATDAPSRAAPPAAEATDAPSRAAPPDVEAPDAPSRAAPPAAEATDAPSRAAPPDVEAPDAPGAESASATRDVGALDAQARARIAAHDAGAEAARAILASVAPAADLGDRYEQFVTMAAWSLLLGDVETARAGAEEAMAIADGLRSPHEVLVCGALLGVVALMEGRGPAAVEALAGVVRAAGQMDAVWSDDDPPEGRGHPLLCLAGARSARVAVQRLQRTGDGRGARGAALDYVLCKLTAAAFLYAADAPADAAALCDETAALLETRPALSAPLRRLAEAARTAA
jgi:hypothetical protein